MTRPPLPPSNESGMLAAEYVLGVLAAAEREAFARRLGNDPGLQAQVRFWEEHFARFANDIPPVAPPPHVMPALEARLFGDPQKTQKPSLWNSLGFWRGLAAASLAVAIAIGGWNLRPIEQTGISPALVAEVAGSEGQVKVVAYYDAGQGELRLNRTAGAPPAGRSFELWLIAGTEKPVSLGVLPDENASRHTVPEALRAKFTNGVLAITDEPLGGSPTGSATGPIVAQGALTAI